MCRPWGFSGNRPRFPPWPRPFSTYLGTRGNRCPCSWSASGREPGDTLRCRTGRVPSCRCSACTRPGSRSPPPRKIRPQALGTPWCPCLRADRCLTRLQRREEIRKDAVGFELCYQSHFEVCAKTKRTIQSVTISATRWGQTIIWGGWNYRLERTVDRSISIIDALGSEGWCPSYVLTVV